MGLKLSPSQYVFNMLVEYGISVVSLKENSHYHKKKAQNLHIMTENLIKKRLVTPSEIMPLASCMCTQSTASPTKTKQP